MKSAKKWGAKLLTATLLMGLPAMAGAEQREYNTVGEYVMNDYESLEAAEVRALDAAKQNAIEQAGVLVENYTRTEDMVVAEDTLKFITSGTLSVLNKQTEYKVLAPGETKVIVRLQSKVDTADVDKYLSKKQEELEEMTIMYNELRKSIVKLNEDTQKIKSQMATMSGKQSMTSEEEELKIKEKQLIVNQKREEIFNIYNESANRSKIAETLADELKGLTNIDAKNSSVYGFLGALMGVDKEMQYYNIALELNPNDEASYCNIGAHYHEKQDYTKAMQYYNKSIEKSTEDYYVFYKRAGLYKDINEYSKAENDYMHALRLRPDSFFVRNELGVMYQKMKEYAKAIKWYTEAIPKFRKEDKWIGYNNRGVVYHEMGDLDKAISEYSNALNLITSSSASSSKSVVYGNRAKVYLDKKEIKNAIADFEKAIDLDKNYVDAIYNLGIIYKNNGYFYKALDCYNNALAIAKDKRSRSMIYTARSDVYREMKQMDNAVKDYYLAIEADDSYANPYEKLGTYYSGKSDYTNAIKYLSRAVALNSEHYIAQYNLALVYWNIKNGEKVLEIGKRMINGLPDKPYGYDFCGKGYELKGMYTMAIQYYEKAMRLDPQNNKYRQEIERARRKM